MKHIRVKSCGILTLYCNKPASVVTTEWRNQSRSLSKVESQTGCMARCLSKNLILLSVGEKIIRIILSMWSFILNPKKKKKGRDVTI